MVSLPGHPLTRQLMDVVIYRKATRFFVHDFFIFLFLLLVVKYPSSSYYYFLYSSLDGYL